VGTTRRRGRGGSDLSGPIEGSIPIATALLGARLLGERLSPARLIGLALAVGGVGVVVPLAVLTGSIAIGTAFLLPGVAFEAATNGPGSFTTQAVALLLFLGLGGAALVHTLWAHGLTHLEATEVAVIGTLMPVVGVGMAALCLGEAITGTQVGGACLVAAGLWVTTRSSRRTPTRPRSSLRPRSEVGAGDSGYAD